MTRALFTLSILLLGGCATNGPSLFATADLPDIPDYCDITIYAPPREPKLNEKQDTTDIEAAKDRIALKRAYRTEVARRKACYEQLKVLLDKTQPKMPNS